MSRKLLLLVFLSPLAAGNVPLKPGTKYDFIALDGQHVYGAVFVKETASAYIVKTDGFGDDLISVEKSILSGPPRPASDTPVKDTVVGRSARVWNLSASGDLRMASGAFADYAQFFPGASLRLSRKIGQVPYAGFNTLSLLAQYAPIARSPRRIDLLNFAVGPKWRKRFRKIPLAEFHAFAAPALSAIRYNSFTFDTWSVNMGLVAAVGADWFLGPNLALTAVLGTHYIYDKSTFVMMHTLSLGAAYSW